MFLEIEVYLKSPPSSHFDFRTLSSSSITLQWSNCRKLSIESNLPLFSYSPFYDLHFVKCSLCLSQDTRVTVCAAVCFDFILVCDPGASPATGLVPVADTLPGQRFATSSYWFPLKKDPHSGEGTEKLAIIKASWQVSWWKAPSERGGSPIRKQKKWNYIAPTKAYL